MRFVTNLRRNCFFRSRKRSFAWLLHDSGPDCFQNVKRRYISSTGILSPKYGYAGQKRYIGGPTSISPESDKYQHLRELTPSLFQTIQNERLETVKKIDDLLQTYLPDVKRSSIEEEIQKASMEQSSSIAEIGPTGNYEYYFNDNALLGTRSYRRRDLGTGQEFPVFHIDFHKEHLGPMSLSVDEKYSVRLIKYTNEGDDDTISSKKSLPKPRQQISIRDIAAQKDFVVNVTAPGDGSSRNLHNVEFGPRAIICHETNHHVHTLFYTRCDDLGRPSEVHACLLDTRSQSISVPEIIFQDSNPAHFVDVQRTKGCDYVAIHSTSKMSNEIRLVGLRRVSDPGDDYNSIITQDDNGHVYVDWSPILVRKRQHGILYYVDCGRDNDLIMLAHEIRDKGRGTGQPKDEKENSTRLLEQELSLFEDEVGNLPQSNGSFGEKILPRSNEKEGIIPSDYFVEDMDIFENHIVLFERSFIDGSQRLQTIERKSGNHAIVPFDVFEGNKGAMLSAAGNIHYQSSTFRFFVESPVQVPSAMQFNFQTKEVSCLDEVEKQDSYHYIRTLVNVDEDEGVRVPLTIVYDERYKHIECPRPIVLIGYGAYGQNQNLAYEPALRPLVKRGFAIAYCHGRGGSELGQQWYEAGCRFNKRNGVTDFLSCASYIAEGSAPSSSPDGGAFIAAKAFSAGGVVVGASVNACPHLFHSVSLTNSFLDVMGSMSKTSHHYLTDHERDEFGNPEDMEAYNSILDYCPLTNVSKQAYPPMLLIGTLDDENVPFHHSLAFGHKVRSSCHRNSRNFILINVEIEGGHHLHGKRLEVSSLEVSFILGQFAKWKAR